jgi:hypothetical protein
MQEICYRTQKSAIKSMDNTCLEIYKKKELESCIGVAQVGISKCLD